EHAQEPHGGRRLAGDRDPPSAKLRHWAVGEEEYALRPLRANDPERQPRYGALEPKAVGEGERPRVDPARGHGLAERAGRKGLRDGPGEGVEERLDVQVRDPPDPEHLASSRP